MNAIKYIIAFWFVLILIVMVSINSCSEYEIKTTVITLPDADIQPVRSLGSHAGDGL